MFQKLGFVLVVVVTAGSLTASAWAATPTGAISGFVRDGSGAPQMGAAVEILGSAAQALKVFTDDRGFYSVASLVPELIASKQAPRHSCLPCATKSASARAQGSW